MGRFVRRATLLALASTLALLALGTPSPAALAAESVPPAVGPTEIEVPYLDATTIEPAPPWRIAECDGPRAASALVTACDEQRIELAAPAYDPEAGVTVIPVQLTNGAVSMTVSYRVRLAPPDAPGAHPSTAARPVASGSLLRVPISDLGLECTVCAEGGTLEALEVEPAAAGSAWATPTHLVFRASDGYTGPVELGFRYADDFGSWSADSAVPVSVYRAGEAPLVALDVFVPLADDGTATIDLSALVTSIAGDDVILVGCGGALHGLVSCGMRAQYAGPAGAVDQFGFQVAAGGEQASGSVTLVPAGSELPADGLVPIAPLDLDESVHTPFTPPVPVEHDDSAGDGIFSPLVAILDRVGAR